MYNFYNIMWSTVVSVCICINYLDITRKLTKNFLVSTDAMVMRTRHIVTL